MLSKCLLCDFNNNDTIKQMKRHYNDVHDKKMNFLSICLNHLKIYFVEGND